MRDSPDKSTRVSRAMSRQSPIKGTTSSPTLEENGGSPKLRARRMSQQGEKSAKTLKEEGMNFCSTSVNARSPRYRRKSQRNSDQTEANGVEENSPENHVKIPAVDEGSNLPSATARVCRVSVTKERVTPQNSPRILRGSRTPRRTASENAEATIELRAEDVPKSTPKRFPRLRSPSVRAVSPTTSTFIVPTIEVKEEVEDEIAVPSGRARRTPRREVLEDDPDSEIPVPLTSKGNRTPRRGRQPSEQSSIIHISTNPKETFSFKEIKRENEEDIEKDPVSREDIPPRRETSENSELRVNDPEQVPATKEVDWNNVETKEVAPVRKRGRPPKSAESQKKEPSPAKTPQRINEDTTEAETDTVEDGGRSARRRRKPVAFDDYVSIEEVSKRTPKRPRKESGAESATEQHPTAPTTRDQDQKKTMLHKVAENSEEANMPQSNAEALDVIGDETASSTDCEAFHSAEEQPIQYEVTAVAKESSKRIGTHQNSAKGILLVKKEESESPAEGSVVQEEQEGDEDAMPNLADSKRIDLLEAAMAELAAEPEQEEFEENEIAPQLSQTGSPINTEEDMNQEEEAGSSHSEENIPICLETDEGKLMLEQVNVSIDGVNHIMFMMVDESGKEVGYCNIDEEGNYQPVDFGDFVVETEEAAEDVEPELPACNIPARGSIQNKIHNIAHGGTQHAMEGDDDGDDGPPQLEPEQAPAEEMLYEEIGPQGQMRYIDEEEMIAENEYLQEEGEEYIDDEGMMPSHMQQNMKTVEFSFLDSKNICCGLCGEIVPYDLLLSEHLPQAHPEFLGTDGMDFEEIPYENWLRDKLQNDKKQMESGFRTVNGVQNHPLFTPHPHQRAIRKVSSVRVCPAEMSKDQLQEALKKKMIEKLGRRVEVTLVDKLHARCEECGSILSLNKKFEIMHLVRHFNAWHPTSHRCSGTWQDRPPQPGLGKPLNLQDFAVTDVSLHAIENLQCIWCGMFMNKDSLAMHFHEVHAEEIEVPKCRLCIEELVVNARLQEQYGEDFQVTLPDETHYNCGKFNDRFTSEKKMQEFIDKRIAGKQVDAATDEPDNASTSNRRNLGNSRMQYGKRNKPKRNFVMPQFRQAVPQNSRYVNAISETQWECRKCNHMIMAAVMSSGCILHYKKDHPEDVDELRYELCKARLERISDGCMEFVHASLIECLMCQVSFALHRPFNMCRAIRHLQKKHGEMMPENHAMNSPSASRPGYGGGLKTNGALPRPPHRNMEIQKQLLEQQQQQEEELVEDQTQQLGEEEIAKLKAQYKDLDFDDVRVMHLGDEPPVYILKNKGEPLNPATTRNIARAIRSSAAQIEPAAQYTIGSNAGREMELLEGEKQMLVRGHVIEQEISEELYEEEAIEGEEYQMELVDEHGNPIANEDGTISVQAANYNREQEEAYEEAEFIEIELEPVEVVREKYADDENAPVPKEEIYFGRQIYNTEGQDGMIFRECPLGYSRRVVHLDDHHFMEYFTTPGTNQYMTSEEEYIEEELPPEELEKWIASQQEKSTEKGGN